MINKLMSIFASILLLIAMGCKEVETIKADQMVNQEVDIDQETKAILETLNNETKAAFQIRGDC